MASGITPTSLLVCHFIRCCPRSRMALELWTTYLYFANRLDLVTWPQLAVWEAVKCRQGDERGKGQQPAAPATACNPTPASETWGSKRQAKPALKRNKEEMTCGTSSSHCPSSVGQSPTGELKPTHSRTEPAGRKMCHPHTLYVEPMSLQISYDVRLQLHCYSIPLEEYSATRSWMPSN